MFRRKKIVEPPARPTYHYKHVLYLKSGFAICHRPQDLGSDFIMFDTKADGKNCPLCLPLLMNFNEKELNVQTNKR